MPYYDRPIHHKRLLLRLLSVFLPALVPLAFEAGYTVAGYVGVIALIAGAFVSVTGIRVSNGELQISRYRLYGWLPARYLYQRGSTATEATLLCYTDRLDQFHTGELWDLLLYVLPKSRFQGVRVAPPGTANPRGAVTEALNDEEFGLVQRYVMAGRNVYDAPPPAGPPASF
ncbi:hypothetical protein [Flaviaesturariibacter amylovorans]|uniref:PH domain-containing protein n=1 Tax=Flaviaesturariibacter amylovorans TaxID=1084520 RepID=A0ABP8G6P6_9BACT